MPEIYDVIIAGAGPAGCSAALHAVRCGLKPLLLDKSVYPREKPCGDALSQASLIQLDELGLYGRLLEAPHVKVGRVSYHAPNGRSVTVPLARLSPHIPAASILCRRVILDHMLLEACREKLDVLDWCEVQDVRVVAACSREADAAARRADESPTPVAAGEAAGADGPEGCEPGGNDPADVPSGWPGLVRVRAVRGGGRAVRFTARALIGADGGFSRVARLTGFPAYREHRKVAVQAYFRQVTGTIGQLEVYFLEEVLPGYFWLYPTESGLTNVGLSISLEGLGRKGMRPRALLAKAMDSPLVRERFEYALPLGPTSVRVLPTGHPSRRIHAPGVALCGDAAGLIHPCSNEGVSHALLSGKLAAESLAVALIENHPWDHRWLRPYPERLWRQLRPSLLLAQRLLALRTPKAIESLIGSAQRRPHNAAWISGILLGSALPSEELDALLGYLDFLGR